MLFLLEQRGGRKASCDKPTSSLGGRRYRRLALPAIVLTMSGALAIVPAVAQVSSDGDIRPVNLASWRAWLTEGQDEGGDEGDDDGKGFAAVWRLESDSTALVTMLVTGTEAGDLTPDTEYQWFAADMSSRLKKAWQSKTALYFRQADARPALKSLVLKSDQRVKGSSHRRVARQFSISKRATLLRARPTDGTFVFHLESRARTAQGDRIDHFLRVQLRGRNAPHLEWFIDAGSAAQIDFGVTSARIDARWAVRPAGVGSGRLTPVAEAIGHRMVPASTP